MVVTNCFAESYYQTNFTVTTPCFFFPFFGRFAGCKRRKIWKDQNSRCSIQDKNRPKANMVWFE